MINSLHIHCPLTTPLFTIDVQEVFDLFDFWDGRDGLVDGAKIGDLLRCAGLNPTNESVLKNGGEPQFGRCFDCFNGVFFFFYFVMWIIPCYYGNTNNNSPLHVTTNQLTAAVSHVIP